MGLFSWGAGLGHGDARSVERRALDAREVLQRSLGALVEPGCVQSVLEQAHEGVGEHAGSHVPADAGFAGVEQRPRSNSTPR